jgi:hypothetical protein
MPESFRVTLALVKSWRTSLRLITFAERQARAARPSRMRFKMKITPTPEPPKAASMPRSGNQPYKGHRWTREEDALVRSPLAVKEVALKTGINERLIYKRRKLLGYGMQHMLGDWRPNRQDDQQRAEAEKNAVSVRSRNQ